MGVFKGLPRGGQCIPAARAHLDSCSAALKKASLWGDKEGQKSREPWMTGALIPTLAGCTSGLATRVPVHFCKAHLHSHRPSVTPTAVFEARSAPALMEAVEGPPTATGNLPPSENTSWKILFAVPNKAVA